MGAIQVILLGLAGAYAGTLIWLRVGFRKACLIRTDTANPNPPPSVSVIVPARNEVQNIAACLESIFANEYEGFEIVVVDDDSTDNTSEEARSFAIERGLTDRLRVIRLKEPEREGTTGHKKRAIKAGIEAGRGDIILTTDADSTVPKHWIRLLVQTFTDGVDFVSAPVAYPDGRSILEQAIALEMLGLVAAGGGAISNGHPTMCNGANLAFRRRAFERVDGFKSIDHLASGDDVLLMLKISADNPEGVRFCADRDALVTTQPAQGWREFVNQRRRWASKGRNPGSAGVAAVGTLVYAFHAVLLFSAFAALLSPGLWFAVATAFAFKLVSEGLLLHASCSHFGRLHLMRSFIPAQFLHIPYVVAIGFLGVFGSGFTWKERELVR